MIYWKKAEEELPKIPKNEIRRVLVAYIQNGIKNQYMLDCANYSHKYKTFYVNSTDFKFKNKFVDKKEKYKLIYWDYINEPKD